MASASADGMRFWVAAFFFLGLLFLKVSQGNARTIREVNITYQRDEDRAALVLKTSDVREKIVVKVLPAHSYLQLFDQLFSGFGAMFMVAPYLPQEIHLDFPLHPEIRRLIYAMYRSENLGHPTIHCPRWKEALVVDPFRTSSRKIAVAYSAGKDSMWNLMRAMDEVGENNVLALHLYGLNRSVSGFEMEATLQQAKKFPIPNLKIIPLENSSKSTGYQIMRARDLFLLALNIPYALEFGASRILTEGFGEEGKDEPFSGREKTMDWFNRILSRLEIPLQVDWKNITEIETVRRLYRGKPKWMEWVSNCFSVPCYRSPLHKNWARIAPSFPLYPYQCGSCVKCRMISVARILYGDDLKLTQRDADAMRKNMANWLTQKLKKGTHDDFLTPSFRKAYEVCLGKLAEIAAKTAR